MGGLEIEKLIADRDERRVMEKFLSYCGIKEAAAAAAADDDDDDDDDDDNDDDDNNNNN